MAIAFYANEKELRDQGLEIPRTETMVREYRSTAQFSGDVAQLSPFGWTVVTSNELREKGGCLFFFKPPPKIVVTYQRIRVRPMTARLDRPPDYQGQASRCQNGSL